MAKLQAKLEQIFANELVATALSRPVIIARWQHAIFVVTRLKTTNSQDQTYAARQGNGQLLTASGCKAKGIP